MPASLQELGLDQWSVADRRWLIDELVESLPDDVALAVDFEDWEIRMIDERLDRSEGQPIVGYTWDEAQKLVWKEP